MDETRLYFPAYGPVEALLGFGLLYYLADLSTPVVVDALAPVAPDFYPEPFTTLVALLLWLALGATVVGQAVVQYRAVRTFESREERDRFLERNRPVVDDLVWHAASLALGALVALLTYERAETAFVEFVHYFAGVFADGVVVVLGNDLGDAVWLVAFFVGFAFLTRGLDRLAVDGLREVVALRHVDDDRQVV